MNSATGSKHPKGLFVLFFTEMWERFSYYGMRALLVLYVTNGLLRSDQYANDNVYGSYTGLVFLTPLLGGYFADRLWGNRRSIITGGFMMAIGQFLMFVSASFYENTGLAHTIMWAGLGMMILGNGFFKPNISSMVGQLYPKSDTRLDAAYTIFYMGINLGAFIGPLITGGFGEKYDEAGEPIRAAFQWGFLSACIAMLIGTFSFIWLKNKYVIDPNGQGLGILPNKMDNRAGEMIAKESTKASMGNVGLWALICLGLILAFRFVVGLDWIGCFIFGVAIAVCGLIITDNSLTRFERGKILVIFTSAFFIIFFWAAFEQAGSSLTLFAERNTDRSVAIHTLLGNVVLFILGIALVLYYVLWRMIDIPKELKLAFGIIAAGAVAFAGYHYIQGTRYNLEAVPASWFNSVNGMFILLLAPILSQVWLGLNRVKAEPSSPKKQSMGLLFLTLGYLVIAFGVKDVTGTVSMMWLFVLYFLHTVGELCLSPIGLSLVNKLAPARFASILMGVWFLSNAAANKLGGTLGALYPGQGPTEILGYQINNLYDFFMVFVVMSGTAALLLFLLTFWMEKKMGDVR
ncbi:MAG TPA: peptide MFS transporter [Chitinophagaceae bacterium]|nr:peptide MFS transporter [Chitinophagaceae bacterium]